MQITPKTKIGELLEEWPQLESVLIDISPAFEKLKNPILRRTIGKVATLQQAATIGQIRVDELVLRLREAVGQAGEVHASGETEDVVTELPDWLGDSQVVRSFDATDVINRGESPMAAVLSTARQLGEGEVLELKSPFVPAPLLDMLKEQGFAVLSLQKEDGVLSYLRRKS
ncbi:DUF1858 domain-containing protein [Geofilum rubicundum]|uniref:DUF1858 domain-containing protein n=1 Tax=Geofilum rubicundum JCM 15548 TaxID=1236989 RepID=A0A0E9LYD6_9BACT|nr:DUF1858 domain-containing protein [Geofilum rubicundum]GAO30146.1 hypothetical protein JCM15548_12399 [Geofilum rubicundum JCM 15548]